MTSLCFDTIPDTITQRALAQSFSVNEKSRREAMLINKNFYYGQQEGQIVFVNEDVDSAMINITKPIVKKRATLLYRRAPTREFDGPAESISFLESVYADNGIDQMMLMADLSAELTGSCLIHPKLDERLPSQVRLVLFDSCEFSVISDEDAPQEAEAVCLVKDVTRLSKRGNAQNPMVETVLKQQVWTRDSVVTYNGSTKNGTAQQALVRSETNELGFIPFANIRVEQVHSQYLGHAPTTSTRKLNEVVNQTLTNLLYIIKMQGFTPVALSGYQSGEGVVIHPGRAFSLPAGADAKVLSTDPKIQEMLETLAYVEEKAYETSSVPKVTIIGAEGESGRELLVRFFPLLQVFEDKAILFQQNELALANVILRSRGLPLLKGLQVTFSADSVLPISPDQDTLKDDIALHLKTSVDEMVRRHPKMTEQEAEIEVRSNQDFNTQLFSEQVDTGK